jgi:hypothetical protein
VAELTPDGSLAARLAMSGLSTPSFMLSRTMTRTPPPSRRKAVSWSWHQMRELNWNVSSRTALRL